MNQNIRLSQFVITYGPGAILEGRNGPRVISRPDLGLFNPGSNRQPAGYEISDQRLSQGLMKGEARIFRLPSNAELGVDSDRYIYSTRQFPDWRLCSNEKAHGGKDPKERFSALYHGWRGCPICHSTSKESQEPIRFIVACRRGHMDDVDWNFFVHFGNQGCQHSGYLKWLGGGGALNDIALQCPRCDSKKTMGWGYGHPWRCSGRFPERDLPRGQVLRMGCTAESWIIQRQASNLRIPELKTLLTIPPRYTALHNLLQKTHIFSALVATGGAESIQRLETILKNLQARNVISQSMVTEILTQPWSEIQSAINDTLTPVSTTYEDLLLEEFHAFIDSSTKGSPPVKGPPPHSQVIFKVNPHQRKVFPGKEAKRSFAVTPILTMRTVTVQTGYRREVESDAQNPVPAEIVDTGFPDQYNPLQKWYPGVEFLGEGIFITLVENEGWHESLSQAEKWMEASKGSQSYPEYVFRSPRQREELHPVFVWWHTLAHLLIRSLSLEAGYSSASIRERVYLENKDGRVRGGIVLYSTQPGSEGTLGGLISLVPYFDDILDTAFDMLDGCSGDPLCIENKFTKGKYNGAACYGCLLISETSCEHRNMWLDRNLLRDNMP